MPTRKTWALVCLTCWAAPGLAAFDPTDVIQVEGTASVLQDNNLYRLPDDVDPSLFGIDPDRKSDTVRSLGLKLRVNKPISRQRLLVEFGVNDIDYHNNDSLDHTAQDLRGSWFWRVGNYWDGEVGYRRQKFLAGFADVRLTFKDLITSERYFASGGYQFHPRWRIGAEVFTRDSTHSAPTRRTLNFDGSGAAVSLTYRTPSQNSLGVEARRNEGEYPNRPLSELGVFDTSFTENEVNGLVGWQFSGKFRLDGALGWTERKHDNVSARDFSGVTGRLAGTWDPTGKIRVTILGSRDIRNFEDIVSSYVLTNTFSVSPIWSITSKIALQGDFIYETRDYKGDPGIPIVGISAREDKLRTARLGIVYSPYRYIDFTVTYERGDRDSNRENFDFDYQTWFGTLRVRF